jgi:hypothetical protein
MSDLCPCHGEPWYVYPSGIRRCDAKRRKWRIENRDRENTTRARWRMNNKEKVRISNAKRIFVSGMYLGTVSFTNKETEEIINGKAQ